MSNFYTKMCKQEFNNYNYNLNTIFWQYDNNQIINKENNKILYQFNDIST